MGRKKSCTINPIAETGPPDGGWGWMCVAGQLYCQFCVLGTASAFGIIYIELVDDFGTSREETAWIGSLANGLMFLIGPIASALTNRFGIQKTVAAGTLLAFCGCFISWFAKGILYLYISYGIMLGCGLGILFLPSIVIVIQYFRKRLGLANAIASCGAGLGTLALPPLYTYLINQYGWRGTLLLLSGLILNCFACVGIFKQPAYIKATSQDNTSKTTKSESCKRFFSLFHNPAFTVFATSKAVAQLGYIVPFIHLPDMAVQAGIERYKAAYLISIMGVSNIVGRIILGWISDLACVNVILLHGVALLVCGVVTAAVPLFPEFYVMAVYCVIQGAGIGVFTAFIPVIFPLLVGVQRTGDAIGLGAILSGCVGMIASPVAGFLFDQTSTYNASFYLAGSTFVFAGVLEIVVMILEKRQARQDLEMHVDVVGKEMNIATLTPEQNIQQLTVHRDI